MSKLTLSTADFKILSSDKRLIILKHLYEKKIATPKTFLQLLKCNPATLYEHLKKLEHNNFIVRKQEGKNHFVNYKLSGRIEQLFTEPVQVVIP